MGPREDHEDYVEAVLELVEQIPPGRVMTYGGIAEWLGRGGPRQVGAVMSHYGGSVPWHRVVNASGGLVPGHEVEARKRHRAEGTPLRGVNNDKVDLKAASWYPSAAAGRRSGSPGRSSAPGGGSSASAGRRRKSGSGYGEGRG